MPAYPGLAPTSEIEGGEMMRDGLRLDRAELERQIAGATEFDHYLCAVLTCLVSAGLGGKAGVGPSVV